jgi:hypothetical protein
MTEPELRISSPRRRPLWLSLSCLALWAIELLVLIGLSPLVGVMFLGLLAGRPRLADWLPVLIPALTALLLTLATIGLWRMRRWGVALLAVYAGLDVVRLALHVPLPWVLLILGLALVDTTSGRQIAVGWSLAHAVVIAGLLLASLSLWLRKGLT